MESNTDKNQLHTPLPHGIVLKRRLKAEPGLCYFLYLPQRDLKNAPIFVSIHGISRNAAEQAFSFAELAERYGVILVAPQFDKARFQGYQRLGWGAKKQRADQALEKIILEVVDLTGASNGPFYMFGFSGGGQFAHRFAMAFPHSVARLALGAPGWYTFPDPTQRFPRGIKSSRHSRLGLRPSRFLHIPTCVLVGENDNLRDDDLNKSPRIDQQQGCDRIERGLRWIQAMVAAARAREIKPTFTFEVLRDSDHSFKNCIKNGELNNRVFSFLFGEPPDKPAEDLPNFPAMAGNQKIPKDLTCGGTT